MLTSLSVMMQEQQQLGVKMIFILKQELLVKFSKKIFRKKPLTYYSTTKKREMPKIVSADSGTNWKGKISTALKKGFEKAQNHQAAMDTRTKRLI